MGEWALPLLEVTSLSLVAWCLADAWRRGWRPVLELAAGALFGLVVEQMAIWAGAGQGRPDAYRYGAFAWMATADVPLVIAASWGALLYAAMKFSDSLGIPCWLRPAADGLYALMLDLTMDVVAVHLGLWQWATPPGAQWFGVPYSNFGGWLLLAALFSSGVRCARAVARGRGGLVYAALLLTVLAALAPGVLHLLGRLFTGSEQDAWPAGLLALLAAAQLAGALLWRRRAAPADLEAALADAPPPPRWWDPALGLPVVWHLSYLGAAALTGVFADKLAILFLTGTMAAAGTLLAVGIMPVKAE